MTYCDGLNDNWGETPVEVDPPAVPPTAAASATPTIGDAPLAVAFSSDGSHADEGTIVSYDWQFGDGQSSSDPNPTHTYTDAGFFVAILRVTDGNGLSDQLPVPVQVLPHQPPIVVATAMPTSGDAPLTVAHVVGLVKAGFYDGQRIHRAIADFVVQFGDPQTRDLSTRALWGRGAAAASGKPIGSAEITRRRLHVKGAVAMAHLGDPAKADSQIYVTLANRPDLDGQYAVFGQILDGTDVVESLQVGDQITRAFVRP